MVSCENQNLTWRTFSNEVITFFVLFLKCENESPLGRRYEVVTDSLSRGLEKVCLVAATPQNRSATDVYKQIKLFRQDDITHLPIDPPNLKECFK